MEIKRTRKNIEESNEKSLLFLFSKKNEKRIKAFQPFILFLRLYNKALEKLTLVLNISELQLIDHVIDQNRLAQKQLFEQFSPKMLGVCRQYVKDHHDAEDVMLRGFMKVFQNIQTFNKEGSFEGWIRKIMIRESLTYLRTAKELQFLDDFSNISNEDLTVSQDFSNDYQKLIDTLPKGCKYVFILNVIEGYKHQEIAEMLNISVGTSKSQLAYAKNILKQQIER